MEFLIVISRKNDEILFYGVVIFMCVCVFFSMELYLYDDVGVIFYDLFL